MLIGLVGRKGWPPPVSRTLSLRTAAATPARRLGTL